MRLIPRLEIMGVCSPVGDPDRDADGGEARGFVVQIAWLGLVIEFAFLREERRYD